MATTSAPRLPKAILENRPQHCVSVAQRRATKVHPLRRVGPPRPLVSWKPAQAKRGLATAPGPSSGKQVEFPPAANNVTPWGPREQARHHLVLSAKDGGHQGVRRIPHQVGCGDPVTNVRQINRLLASRFQVPRDELTVVVFPQGGYLVTCQSCSVRDRMADDPDSIPKGVHFQLEEPLPLASPDTSWPVEDQPKRRRLRPLKLLAYRVLVHLDQVLDYRPPSTEPASGIVSPISIDDDGPKRFDFIWALGVKTARGLLASWFLLGIVLNRDRSRSRSRSLPVRERGRASGWDVPQTLGNFRLRQSSSRSTGNRGSHYDGGGYRRAVGSPPNKVEQGNLVEFLAKAFKDVPAPLLPTPARGLPRGRPLKKSPPKMAQIGRRSERLAKKSASRLGPSRLGDLAQEEATAKYVKLFKQPLTPDVIEAFSSLVAGCAIGEILAGKKIVKEQRRNLDGLIIYTAWGIWLQRNNRIFNGTYNTVSQVVESIIQMCKTFNEAHVT
uniref:Uncharacterized protein n=1 Tax=Oryza meridionalis TaxID=40149 RepID=A0A0E0EQR6_9ORYZ